jgi:hypothetical protein
MRRANDNLAAGLAHLDTMAHRDHQTSYWLDLPPRRRRWGALRWVATLILFALALAAIGGLGFLGWGLVHR